MQTKSAKGKSWIPPRGVALRKRANRDTWVVEWRDTGKSQRQRSFRTREKAEAFAREIADSRRKHGQESISGMDATARREYGTIKEALGSASVTQLLAVWERHKREILGGSAEMTLGQAVERYLALRRDEGLGSERLRHVDLQLKRFTAGMGEKLPLLSLDATGIREWLGRLRTNTGFGETTLMHYFKAVKALLGRARKEGWIGSNPADQVMAPKPKSEEVTVLSIEHGESLFAVNRDNPVSLRLALEAFGALRYTSACRIRFEDIKWDDKGILLPGVLHKTGKRHYLEKLPDNLWGWLERWKHAPAAWTMSQRQYLAAKSEAFKRAGIPHPKNVLRHSFCSYHVALHSDAARTALLLQHADQVMLYKHYKGVATASAAKRWFEISPH